MDIDLDFEDGFYLGVVDQGTCIILTRLLVFYYVCPEETSELTYRPEALGSQVSVTGECVENSSTMSGTAPVLSCSERGEWQVIISCLCNPGYEKSQDQCTGILQSNPVCLHLHFYSILTLRVSRGYILSWSQ